MTRTEALDKFGELLVRAARDIPISHFEKTVSGEMRDAESRALNLELARFTPRQLAIVRTLVVRAIDEALHHALWMLEQNPELQLSLVDSDARFNLVQVSDGLSGELYTEHGWLERFSKFK